jgi:hypothetical protein
MPQIHRSDRSHLLRPVSLRGWELGDDNALALGSEIEERRPRTVREMVGIGFFPDEVALPDVYPDLPQV